MKLTETIDKCIELVNEEIEGYDFFINEYEDKVGYSTYVEKLKKEKKEWLVHLENLKLLKVDEEL